LAEPFATADGGRTAGFLEFTALSAAAAAELCVPLQKGRLMTDDQTINNLVEELQHQRPEVRWDAAVKLGKIGSRAANALPALQVALSDPDGLVRKVTQEAIAKITDASERSSEVYSGNLKEVSWPPRNYDDVPWYRREPGAPVFLLAILFTPVTLALCAIALTGDVYKNAYDKNGNLERWGMGNKVAGVLILLIQGFLIFAFSRLR